MTAPFVHASAVVDPGAELGAGVKVWHFTHVSAGASIGAGTMLGQNVFVASNVRVGARVKVQNNVSLYEGVELADEVFVGPSCVFTNVVQPRAFIERKSDFRPTRVGRGATLGANATVVCGHSIGAYAMVGAGATVTRDVPDHALVTGTPARLCGWVCRCGEKLPAAQQGDAVCTRCAAHYRIEPTRCSFVESERTEAVPFFDLAAQSAECGRELRAAFERVLASNQFILGDEVARFEQQLCTTLGFAHAIAVSSGTDALLVSLMALGVGPGDEVITTPFSFFATAGSIVRLGARPVFVDIDPSSYNLDPRAVASAITPRTKVLLPVHLFGLCADMAALSQVAERHGLALLEDGAQALGATQHGRPAGSFGQLGCFSFFPTKNLGGLGDGGLVVTRDARLAERVRMLRSHGASPKYHHRELGGNFRLDALQAALLAVKLPRLDSYTRARREHAAYYDQRLAPLDPLRLRRPIAGHGLHTYNQYVIRCEQRDALRAHLTRAGIGSEVYYPRCLHEQECLADLRLSTGALPEAERAAREVLALPIFPELRALQRTRVVEAITGFFSEPLP